MNFDKFVKSEWEATFEKDFAFLKKIPSSDVLTKISLFEKNKDLFTFEFILKLSSDRTSIPKDTLEMIWRMQSSEKSDSLDYLPVNDLKAIIKNRLSICKDHEEREILEKAQAAYKDISNPKAKEIRKAFFPKIEKYLRSKPVNEGAGIWSFPFSVGDRPMKLTLDFGGRFSTFRYWVDVFPDQKPEKVVFLTYEKIMGFSDLDWDLMRSDLLDEHADILIEAAERTIKAISNELK